MKPQIKAIYLSVENMERAIKFYEDIFEVKVSSSNEKMSSFDFDNISLLLFNPSIDGENTSIGNNIVPNIEVENISKILEFIKSRNCEIIMPLTKIDKYLIFQIEDTEKNIIEIYQIER